jgi:hypothetical protein
LTFGKIDWTPPPVSTSKCDNPCGNFNKDCSKTNRNIVMVRRYIKNVINYIKQIFGIYSVILKYIAHHIYNSTDGKLFGKAINEKSDEDIIINILHYFVMVPISVFFAYNWFYILFFKDEAGNLLKNDFANIISSSLKGILHRFFKCLVAPVILVNAILRSIIPNIYFGIALIIKQLEIGNISFEIIGDIMDNQLFIFIWLTLVIFFMTCNYSDAFESAFYSYLGDGNENEPYPYVNYLHGIVAYDWIVGIVAIPTVQSIYSPILTAFWFFILVFFSHWMINFAGIFIMLYFYISSYFSLYLYSSTPINDTINSIHDAFKRGFKKQDHCPSDPSYLEMIIQKIFEIINSHILSFMYTIALIASLIIILFKMKSVSTEIILSTALGTVVFTIILFIIMSISEIFKKNINKSDFDL